MTTSVFCKINQFAILAGLCNNLAGTWKNELYFWSEVKIECNCPKKSLWYGKSIFLKKSNIFQAYLFALNISSDPTTNSKTTNPKIFLLKLKQVFQVSFSIFFCRQQSEDLL